MLIVAGTFEMAPEDRAAFLESRTQAILASRAEDGCVDYAFSADSVDPGKVRLFECWASQAALDTHLARMRASREPGGAPAAPEVTVTDRSVGIYDIAGDGPRPLG